MVTSRYSGDLYQFNVGISPVRTGPCLSYEVIPSRLSKGLSSDRTSRLTKHALTMYLDPPEVESSGDNNGQQLFYKLANLDDRIKNADQYLAEDIQQLSRKLAEIYSNIAKPVLDVM